MRFPLAIIPAAGRGTRMLSTETPKCLLEVNGKPLIEHVVRFWAQHADRFAIVVAPGTVVDIGRAVDVTGLEWFPVCQPEPKGIADAVWRARDLVVGGPFVVALADCLFRGTFVFPEPPFCGVAVQRRPTDDWGRSYAVRADGDGKVCGIIEKPALGLGAYFFGGRSYLGPMEGAQWDAHLEKIALRAVLFEGEYRNVNTPEDLGRWGH